MKTLWKLDPPYNKMDPGQHKGAPPGNSSTPLLASPAAQHNTAVSYGASSTKQQNGWQEFEDDDDVEEILVNSDEVLSPAYVSSLPLQEKQSKAKEGIKITALLLLASVALGVALLYLRFVLVPLVLARIFVYMLQPLINILSGKKKVKYLRYRCCLPRWLSILISFLLVVGLIAGVCVVVYFSVMQVVQDSEKYLKRWDDLQDKILDWAEEQGFDKETILENLPDLSDFALYFVSALMSFGPGAFLCIMFLIYMLLEYDPYEEKSKLRRRIDVSIRKYLLLKLFISLLTGALITVILLILTVDLAIVFGLLTFLLNFIPSIGSIIAVLLPIPIVVLDPDQQWWVIVLVIVLPMCVQLTIGNFVEPKLMGQKMEMSAVAVLFALAFWGSIWGIVGAFLSVPITVVLRLWLLGIDHPSTNFLGRLLGGDFAFFEESEVKKEL